MNAAFQVYINQRGLFAKKKKISVGYGRDFWVYGKNFAPGRYLTSGSVKACFLCCRQYKETVKFCIFQKFFSDSF
jgi:hypothetical protein